VAVSTLKSWAEGDPRAGRRTAQTRKAGARGSRSGRGDPADGGETGRPPERILRAPRGGDGPDRGIVRPVSGAAPKPAQTQERRPGKYLPKAASPHDPLYDPTRLSRASRRLLLAHLAVQTVSGAAPHRLGKRRDRMALD
jgi:hypothetical protein